MLSIILLVIASRSFASMQLCGKDNSIDISKGTHLSNGDIYYNGVKFAISEYYVDSDGTERGCLCKKEKCLRKCCPYGFAYEPNKKICVNTTEPFAPTVWDEYNRLLRSVNATKKFHFTFGKQNCTGPDEYRIRVGAVTRTYHLRKDGKLYIELASAVPPWTVVGPDKYCIDTFVNTDNVASLDALVCFADKDEVNYIIKSSCMLVSCVFIIATVGVYSWLPELRNLHGRVLMSYLLCLFVGFSFMASMQILLSIDNIGAKTCVSFTFIIYFFLLAAFFWLNVMSFDIWRTFSRTRMSISSFEELLTKIALRLQKQYVLRKPVDLMEMLGLTISGPPGNSLSRFSAYAIYAFSVPTVLTIIMAGLEFSGMPTHPLLPNIKHQGCFLYGTSKLLYLYGPIAILCIANSVFFVLTAMKIAETRKQTHMLRSKGSSSTNDRERNNDQQRLLLYVKLFAVMGINWLLEVISSLYPEAECIWQYTDAYNVLIGLIIFIIFVCKRKIFRLLKNRYKQLRGDPISRTATTSSRSNSTRDDVNMSTIKANNNDTPI